MADKSSVGAIQESALVSDALTRLEKAIIESVERQGFRLKTVVLYYADDRSAGYLYTRGCSCDACMNGVIQLVEQKVRGEIDPTRIETKMLHS